MSALEQEIIEKFRLLEPDQRVHVLSVLTQEITDSPFDFDGWMAEADAIRAAIQAEHPHQQMPSAAELLDEIREERVDDIIRSIGFGNAAGNRTD